MTENWFEGLFDQQEIESLQKGFEKTTEDLTTSYEVWMSFPRETAKSVVRSYEAMKKGDINEGMICYFLMQSVVYTIMEALESDAVDPYESE